jgi:hypothetical protein
VPVAEPSGRPEHGARLILDAAKRPQEGCPA